MKIFKVLLIGLGALFILVCLGIFGLSMSAGEPLACKYAAERLQDLENAVKSYETAKASGKKDLELAGHEGRIETDRKSFNLAQSSCASGQSSKRFGQTIAVLLGVLGVVMLAVGFIVGRKRATS